MIADQVFLCKNPGFNRIIGKTFRNHNVINILFNFRSDIL